MSNQQNIAVFEFTTIGFGHQCLNSVLVSKSLEIVEAAVTSQGGFYFILLGEHENLVSAKDQVEKLALLSPLHFSQTTIVSEIHPNLLLGVANMGAVQLREALVILESSHLGELLQELNEILKMAEITIIDFVSPRGTSGQAAVFLTGSSEATEKVYDKASLNQKITCSSLDSLNETYTKYFNLSPSV